MSLPIPATILILIMICIKGLIDGLVRPSVEKFGWSTNVLRYGAWLLGVVFVVLAKVLPQQTFLLILLALVAGCGSNILQEFLSAFGNQAGKR